MKKIIKDALILFIITAVAGLLLALVNELTKEPIMAEQKKAKDEACTKVFPSAVRFEQLDIQLEKDDSLKNWKTNHPKQNVEEIYAAKDASDNNLGYVINISTSEGYGSKILFAMGVNNERILNGISILSSQETVGLGLEAEKVLVPQFEDKNVESFTYTKNGSSSDSEIDAISSATITTNAFVNAVNSGLEFFDILKGGEY